MTLHDAWFAFTVGMWGLYLGEAIINTKAHIPVKALLLITYATVSICTLIEML